MINIKILKKLYVDEGLSMVQVANRLGTSQHKVAYWMDKYTIRRRTISDAVYARNHPNGHPFKIKEIDSLDKAVLYGTGIGLYWGEGTKANKHSVRLGNTDPELLNTFIKFLVECFDIDRSDLRFGLQVFTDIDAQEALEYWANKLSVHITQFYKTHVTKSGSIGTYREKSRYGVVTVYYHNSRLRDIIVGTLPR